MKTLLAFWITMLVSTSILPNAFAADGIPSEIKATPIEAGGPKGKVTPKDDDQASKGGETTLAPAKADETPTQTDTATTTPTAGKTVPTRGSKRAAPAKDADSTMPSEITAKPIEAGAPHKDAPVANAKAAKLPPLVKKARILNDPKTMAWMKAQENAHGPEIYNDSKFLAELQIRVNESSGIRTGPPRERQPPIDDEGEEVVRRDRRTEAMASLPSGGCNCSSAVSNTRNYREISEPYSRYGGGGAVGVRTVTRQTSGPFMSFGQPGGLFGNNGFGGGGFNNGIGGIGGPVAMPYQNGLLPQMYQLGGQGGFMGQGGFPQMGGLIPAPQFGGGQFGNGQFGQFAGMPQFPQLQMPYPQPQYGFNQIPQAPITQPFLGGQQPFGYGQPNNYGQLGGYGGAAQAPIFAPYQGANGFNLGPIGGANIYNGTQLAGQFPGQGRYSVLPPVYRAPF